jgi:putative phosphoribosyl transferase
MFASRADAGRQLGEYLLREGVQASVVLGLPRGGVVVASEVARVLHTPLDVLIVRKIGHPLHREFAVGALAEGEVAVLDEALIARTPMLRAGLNDIISEEMRRLKLYQASFHPAGRPALSGRDVLLVDDGLATGATTEAAVLSARRQNARIIVVAAPVASSNAIQRLAGVADQVRVLVADPNFEAVGAYYQEFTQTTDEEVLELLKAAA